MMPYYPYKPLQNGCKRKPEAGALLIWQEGGEFKHTGHVAIITEVLEDKIRIAEAKRDSLSLT